MASRLITILIVCSILCPLLSGSAIAIPANQGIWLQSTNSGDQAWAYYPYNTTHPYTGGNYSPVNNGTAYFIVSPGTTIVRKIIVHNHETYNDSVNFSVIGLPDGWIARCSPVRIASLQNYVQFPNHVSKYVLVNMTHEGYSSLIVTIPSNASPGSYSYMISAVSRTGYTSTLMDKIVVGPVGSPSPSPTASILGQVTVNGVATNGVTVTCGSAAAVQTSNNTSSDGIFIIGGLHLGQSLTINASYNGYNNTRTVDPISDGTQPIWVGIMNIDMPITPSPTASILGQVTVNGVPTNDVTVTCDNVSAVQTSNNTSSDGIFIIGGLPLGQSLTINASYNGYNNTRTVDPISDDTQPIWVGIMNIDMPITPSPTASILGQVTVNGVTTNGVTVTCGSAAAVQTSNNTSSDGIFIIGGLPLGQSLTINASYNGYNNTRTVDPISDDTQPIWVGIMNIDIPATPTPIPNMLVDPGFENGSINKSVWVGSKSTNFKNDHILVTPIAAHNGTYGIVGARNDYSRAAQNVPYGGHGFEFSAWFYVNLSDQTRTSNWAGVLNVDNSNNSSLDNLNYSRAIGYNNRSSGYYHDFQYVIGAYIYRNLSQVNQSGWYKGDIFYNGTHMTYAEYDSLGNPISNVTYPDPGFVPASVIVNAASMSQYIDDLYYTTW